MDLINQKILLNLPDGIELFIKREDKLHPIVSGNKFRKLKYNIQEAKKLGHTTLLTFGGAFSNHILAVAGAGAEFGFKTIGVIRGEELASKVNQNPTLFKAKELGMDFYFVSRSVYQEKESESFVIELKDRFGDFYLIPEGGTNKFAIKGCEEILTEEDKQVFSHVVCAVGTGGTFSGLINSSNEKQQLIGFSSLKGAFLSDVIRNFAEKTNWEINDDYHFGGYGKVTDEFIHFLNSFYNQTNIPLDPVYTGKMVFGILEMIKNGYFAPKSKILMIHTGGLQGIKGMNFALQKKNKEIIQYDKD
ncbi:1-aminocyclopropane-1-carboxylate deaminase/D-cysteine desulfhydrase [Flavobacterium channae]|uniref:1-aminocyclopropane-1-carboxylate deaminase/D-cysteine desulfhydrase n=1 Tax=Flavobacterium channae TaxID=2897181 RepID=UPI001E5FB2BA|nr:pyridoxal-phosphate dependent enzyme [Flavobacterium channae]UGS23102.1 pyridoxal-phosphate dependent enzyme [Flavobacterium channae]